MSYGLVCALLLPVQKSLPWCTWLLRGQLCKKSAAGLESGSDPCGTSSSSAGCFLCPLMTGPSFCPSRKQRKTTWLTIYEFSFPDVVCDCSTETLLRWQFFLWKQQIKQNRVGERFFVAWCHRWLLYFLLYIFWNKCDLNQSYSKSYSNAYNKNDLWLLSANTAIKHFFLLFQAFKGASCKTD